MSRRKVEEISVEKAKALQKAYATASAQVSPELICPVCEGPFTQKRFWQKFCSPKCRQAFFSTMRRSRK